MNAYEKAEQAIEKVRWLFGEDSIENEELTEEMNNACFELNEITRKAKRMLGEAEEGEQ